jgi:hypothetical protein
MLANNKPIYSIIDLLLIIYIQNKFLKRRVLFRLISIQFYLVTDSYHKTNLICYSTMVSDVSYNLREVIVNTKYNVVVLLCIEISDVLDSSFINIINLFIPSSIYYWCRSRFYEGACQGYS